MKLFAITICCLLFTFVAGFNATPDAPEPSNNKVYAQAATPKKENNSKPPANKPKPKPKPEQQPIWVTNPQSCDLHNQWVHADGSCHDKQVAQSAPAPSYTPVATTSGVEQWRGLVSQYDWNVDLVLAIMRCESGGNAAAVGDTTTAYSSYGLMQIRALPGRPDPSWLLIPENNISYAYQLSAGGANWHPWSCFYKI
jgi:hypothetical protein